MNSGKTTTDNIDEEILTCAVSDETLETAGDIRAYRYTTSPSYDPFCCGSGHKPA